MTRWVRFRSAAGSRLRRARRRDCRRIFRRSVRRAATDRIPPVPGQRVAARALRTSKMVALWNNFHALAASSASRHRRSAVPDQASSCVIGHRHTIERRSAMRARSHRSELGIVIGRAAINVPVEDAARTFSFHLHQRRHGHRRHERYPDFVHGFAPRLRHLRRGRTVHRHRT